jgi:electron transfer flavoprotein alpha subunit
MKVLIIAEHDNNQLQQATLRAVSAALKIAPDIDLMIVGSQCDSVVNQAKKISELQTIKVADLPVYQHQLAENTAALIAEQSAGYSHILATSSTFSKNLLPRVAALLDVGMISEVVEIKSSDTFVRAQFAGNILATVQSNDVIKVLTIRGTAFPKIEISDKPPVEAIEKIDHAIPALQVQFVSQALTPLERPELTTARIVLSGGRGLKSAENFKLLENIADQLGAAVGASRAAVDAGYAPNDYQVGQTGKVIAPDLYIAVGISGAIQHLAGMKDSKIIVAINNDPNAPILQSADYILIGDLFQILPELQIELNKSL